MKKILPLINNIHTIKEKKEHSYREHAVFNKEKPPSHFFLWLFCIYTTSVIFGDLFRLDTNMFNFGLSSVILCIIAFFAIRQPFRQIFRERLWLALIMLLVWLCLSTTLNGTREGYQQLLRFAAYVLFAIGLSTVQFSREELEVWLMTTALALLICSLLTLLDLRAVVDLPLFNEHGEKFGGVVGASGPFSGRTSMASYFSILLPLIFCWGFGAQNWSLKAFSLIVFTIAMTTIMCSFNRSAPLAIVLSMLFFCFLSAGTLRQKAKALLTLILALCITMTIINIFFPMYFDGIVRKAKITIFNPSDDLPAAIEQRQADTIRIAIADGVFRNIAANPIGYGLGSVTMIQSKVRIGAHSTIIEIIWAAGIFGLIWLPFFTICLFMAFAKHGKNLTLYSKSIKYAILASFLHSLVHSNWNNGLLWALFAITVQLQEHHGPTNHNNSPEIQ